MKKLSRYVIPFTCLVLTVFLFVMDKTGLFSRELTNLLGREIAGFIFNGLIPSLEYVMCLLTGANLIRLSETPKMR